MFPTHQSHSSFLSTHTYQSTMELENPMLRAQITNPNPETKSSSTSSPSTNDLCLHCESFKSLETGVPSGDHRQKLTWLRSQIVGNDAEFSSPFGKRRLTYLDLTASGRSLRYVESFIVDNVLPYYGNTHSSDSYVGQRTTKMVEEAGKYIKRCVGGKEEDDVILFCGSGATAAIKKLQECMAITVPSILRERVLRSCLATQERWVVFVGPYEHHSNLLSWRQSLAEVVEIGLDHDGLLDTEALRSQLESYARTNRPMLGSFSACSNVTGIYSDTRRIASLLHEYGAFVCFDFATSGPYVDIEMRSGEMDGYDAIFLSPHKFLAGPGSPGILVMSKALYLLKSSPPSTCGGGTVNYVNGFDEKDTLYMDSIEERESGGTPQIIQITRAALAFWVKDYIGHELIQKYEEMHIHKALDMLLPNPNIVVLGSTTKNAKRHAILSFVIYSTTTSSSNGKSLNMWRETGNKRDKPLHGPFVSKLLNDLFGIQARGGCACAGPYGHSLLHVDNHTSLSIRSAIQKGYGGVKPGWTRISFPYYMSEEEFEFVVAALEFVAFYGQRFLPLYDFDLRTGDWTFKKKTKNKKTTFEDNEDMLGRSMQAIRMIREDKIEETGKIYRSYMEKAKHVASLLPKFPSQRSLPHDIDHELLLFRL